MSPKWLEKNAELIAPHTIYPQYLEILPVATSYERALRVQLVAPNVLKSTDTITVKAVVSLDTTLATTSDHDPILGISDTTSFIGFAAYDVLNYPSYSPCSAYESDVDGKVLKTGFYDGGVQKLPLSFILLKELYELDQLRNWAFVTHIMMLVIQTQQYTVPKIRGYHCTNVQ